LGELSLGRRREGANVKGIILRFIKVKLLDKIVELCYNICRIRERKREATMKVKEVQAVKILGSADRMSWSSKKGTFTAKRGFFYTHGNTAKKYADKLATEVPGFELVEAHEHWAAWPKDSYWSVEFRADGKAAAEKLGSVLAEKDLDWAEVWEETRVNRES